VRLNTKMRYGTRALLELALDYNQGPVSLSLIAARQELSEKYLEALLGQLRAAGLVQSQRGAQGGYLLAKPPSETTLRAIYDVLEGPEPFVQCSEDSTSCHRWADCVTRQVWAKMNAASMQVLETITLADLVEQIKALCPSPPMYHI
jgi:Rrf2 family cysteine metabolism transcriptional repressor